MQQTFTQEQQISPHSKITIENITGNISISTWQKNKIHIEAIKTGTKESLQLSTIDIKYTKNEVSLKTISLKSDKERLCAIDYNLIIPESALLSEVKTKKGNILINKVTTETNAHAASGSIILKNVENTIYAKTIHGPITVELNGILPTQNITALTTRGNIFLKIPEKTNALLSAKTTKGKIISDCLITLEPQTIKISKSSLALKRNVKGSLGSGGNTFIKLESHYGNVKLVEA